MFEPELQKHILIATLIILVAGASFGLGRLSTIEAAKTPVTIDYFSTTSPAVALPPIPTQAEAESAAQSPAQGAAAASSSSLVASKNGKAYYWTSCSGASRISDANKIYFSSEQAAAAAGYYLAKNCNP